MDATKLYRYWGVLALLVWGTLVIGLGFLRFDAYGIDESAARALLLNWSVSDRVVNPIVTLGAPDFRALLFLPLGAYWAGSFVALKVFMLLTLFASASMLYRWSKEYYDGETALIATGLLLIAPLSFMQINAVGAGPFLLLGFAVGYWLNNRYRNTGKQLSGWYFTQLLLVVTLTGIHPAGLAYALALAWEWRINPIDGRQQKQLHIGIAIAATFGLLFNYLLGNPSIDWGLNPVATLGAAVLGRIPGDPSPIYWSTGIVPALLVVAVIFFQRKALLNNLMTRMLFIAAVIGMSAADYGWAFIVLALTLYAGTPLLIKLNKGFGGNNFVGQRGIVMAVLFVLTTAFMISDRGYRGGIINATLEPTDDIIRSLAVETEDMEDHFFTISQWPAKTMLALKRPVFPLPPEFETSEELFKNIGKIDFIVFDPVDPVNKTLRDQLASSSHATETLIQQHQGVIVKVLHDKSAENTPSPIL
ncbi:hypothetical protein ACFL2V_14575 [Pseudomonadota bacterium]